MPAVEIARWLLISVYHPVSAVVRLDKRGKVQHVRLFDTEFGDLLETGLPEEGEVWLMSNHPDGSASLSEADILHIAQIRKARPAVHIRAFVTNEDFICREIAL